ncbi:ATP-binding protein [Roseibium sp.]|uniref:ATP-binding protein n=1 Tax=Roseibium sp. TaxID=1936156 RepID=UPI003B53016C
MDHQTQTFLDLTGTTDLVELVPDRRAAWLWSSDGGRVLWANAAGAAFFSAQSINDLASLAALERSPARPHIARIAASGFTDRFSIDRLRFYRGLRVMLLTCQCKKVDLADGETAALIVCADKGFTTTKDPVATFAHLVAGAGTSVFLTDNGAVKETIGALTGTPEDLELPRGQMALYGPLDLAGALHNGAVFKLPDAQKLVVLDNQEIEAGPQDTPLPAAVTAEELPNHLTKGTGEEPSAWARADALDTEQQPSAQQDTAPESGDELQTSASETADDVLVNTAPENSATGEELPAADLDAEEWSEADDAAGDGEAVEAATSLNDTPEATEDTEAVEETADSETTAELVPDDDEDIETEAFVFQPGRRPVRFAWKMDITQRFTFLSDEFSEVVGPASADIVGLTWAEVADRFDLDPRGSIARALDRRDTWSGKTVDWPVTDAALRVPVDMAALPAFDRNRKFEGYRGFGVCRAADAKPGGRIAVLSPAMAAFDEGLAVDDADTSAEPDKPVAETASEIAEAEVETEASANEIATPETVEAVSPPAPAAEELKPKQPDALAGKTFIGASAAALVGSLARFTGATPPPKTEQTSPAAPSLNPSQDDADTANPDPDDVSEESALNDADTAIEEPLTAAVAMDEVLEQAAAPSTTEETPASEPVEPAEKVENELADEGASEAFEETPPTDDSGLSTENADYETGDVEPSAADLPADAEIETPADSSASAETETSLADLESSEDEPAGISGTASLDAAEIESAVKSLQKSYKKSTEPEPDLFEGNDAESSEAPVDRAAVSASESEETLAGTDDTAADEAETEVSETNSEEDDSQHEDLSVDTTDEEPKHSDKAADEEREFFEETAAFEAEELAKEFEEDLAASDNVETLPPAHGDNVIPLATVKPRVVPVDTSGLSRPERQAFRKIAEALGARLEGDLEGWDEPDTEEPDLPELPPEVPEAGPIDPTLLDRLPIGIAIAHDRDVLYANKALLSLLGYQSIAALSEAGGLEALFIDEAEDLPDAEGMVGELDETMKVRLADGGVRSVDAHMHSVPWNGSRGLMISITERTAKPAAAGGAPASPNFFAEVRGELDRARDQISEMDTILETATDGVLVLDENGTILKVNGSAEALFSANRGEMIGTPFIDFLAPESHSLAKDYLDGLSRNGVASILNDGREVLGKVPSGGLIPLFMTMGRISGAEDTKFCVVLRDITQWKTAEEELTQAKRQAENASSQKSDFLAKISHEIRTPLNAIIGFSEVMMEERFGSIGNERYKDYLKDIRTSGSHIMSLVNDLLDLSKIEAGKQELQFASVSANEIINECVALMQPQANRERVIIRASVPDTVPNIVADQRSLRQIVLNLLSNGIKYNKSGGQVILSTTLEANGEVALRVRDTGSGMTPKQLAAALEPFRQVHTARRGGGTGLGLPLTKALAEANRAQFHIDSTPDQGTLVEITFPTERVLSE